MRWVLAWVLMGSIVQLGGRIYLRARFGGRGAEVGLKSMGVTWWVSLIAILLWPIDLVFRFLPLSFINRIPALKVGIEEAVAEVDADASKNCPDCGEPWMRHEDHGP
jgi:hypothetical protein